MTKPAYDVVVFGATSFVGKILSRYLVETFGDDLKWAAAARSPQKLDDLCASLGEAGAKLPTIYADAGDEAALRDMCGQTRVVISTVGPYALYGEQLVQVCAETGTDYCDLTGEVQWIKRMIDRYENAAKDSGARIVHCCGFDSIPSDMGTFFLQQEAQKQFGQPCTQVKMRVKAIRGGASGGTVASLVNVVKEAARDADLRRQLADPYLVCPPDYRPAIRQPDVKFAQFDADFGAWVGPFVMAAINTRILQRSNALQGRAYGDEFTYDEAMLMGEGIKGAAAAAGFSAGLGGFITGASLPPTRWLLEKFLPAPGEGPSEQEQKDGFYDLRFFGRTADGQILRTRVTGDQDPGYGSTAKMLGQAGACLAFDFPAEEKSGGFWTPASMFGEKLIPRLTEHAGLTFEVL